MSISQANTLIKERYRLLSFAEDRSRAYCSGTGLPDRKQFGQYFTPTAIAGFMAGLFSISKNSISILDPGAGCGILSAALCDQLLYSERRLCIHLSAYEIDERLVPILRDVLSECSQRLNEAGHDFEFEIINGDFIVDNADNPTLFQDKAQTAKYDLIISNPPYFKLAKDSDQSRALPKFVSGQPNIYSLFLGLSANMLAKDGQFVFISPRSFCSGLYFQRFRKWFLENMEIQRIHAFHSRQELFDGDGVLQENIIVKAVRNPNAHLNSVEISVSKNKDFSDSERFNTHIKELIHRRNGHVFLRVPHSRKELEAINFIDSFPHTLNELGLEISTGPVVAFRATEHLIEDHTINKGQAPLLWAHNLKGGLISWPIEKPRKHPVISVNDLSKKIILPSDNYVLIKRFTSKEQDRRVVASAFLHTKFPHSFVGLENHLNYIHRPKGSLNVDEALGVTALLNSRIYDTYFRVLNGNTQVNATDIRNIPLPSLSVITSIGEKIRLKSELDDSKLQILLTENTDDWLMPYLENRIDTNE